MKFIKTSIYSTLLSVLLTTSSFADCSYELFSISSAKDTKIIDFVDQLSDECGFSIIVTDPNAEKFLSKKLNKTNLKNLTIDEVLDIVLTENNLSYTLENNLLKISYLRTKVYGIDYILSQRKSKGSTDVTLSSSSNQQNQLGGAGGAMAASGGAGGSQMLGGSGSSNSQSGIKIESSDEVKFWEELDLEFQKVLNRPHDVYEASAPIINKNAGLVTVTATDKQIKRFTKYLKKLQEKVQLQVLIDVQLLSVTMSEGKTTGIDWKQLYALQNIQVAVDNRHVENVTEFDDISITEGTYSGAKAIASMVTVKADGQLNQVIKFLQTQGDVNSISNPKVLTLNNQPALITAGREYFYKITSTETLAGGAGAGAQSQNQNVQSVFAGVLLTITPEIADDKTITLKINPSLSETASDISQEKNDDRTMPPDLTRRQLSSVVTVKDGNRIILGGLINTTNTNESNKVPILGDIPIISYLFKYEEKIKQVQELVIIIEPHIIDREINSVSLAELGYEGLSDDILLKERSAKQTVSQSNQADSLSVQNSPKVGLTVPKKLTDEKK